MSTAYQQFWKGIMSFSSRRLFKRDRCVYWLCITLHLLLSVMPSTLGDVLSCKSQQHFEIHRPGIISCSVSESIYGFYWYYEDNPQSIVTLLEDRQAGPRSGDLTIAQNGSLIFSNVSLSDEGKYRVDAILDAGGDVSMYIDVSIVVTSKQSFPVIDGCQGDDCRLFRNGEFKLACTMIGRPAVTLTWYNDTAEAPVTDATEQSYKDPSSDMFVSSSSISVIMDIEQTQTLSCTPSGLSVSEKTKNASVLLMGPTNTDNVYRAKYIDINEDTGYNELLKTTCDRETMFTQTSEPSGKVIRVADKYDDHGPLVLTSMCPENHTYTRTSIKLLRYKIPDDNSVSFVEQCQSKDNCIIAADDGNATLTCVVNNTRPAAEILWKVLDRNVTIIETSAYSSCIFDVCNSSVTIRVKVTSYNGQIEYPQCLMCLVTLPGSGFRHESKVTLKLNGTDNVNPSSDIVNPSSESFTSPAPSQSPSTTPNEVNRESGNNWVVNIFLIISLIINVILILIGVIIYISRSKASKRKDGENKIKTKEPEEENAKTELMKKERTDQHEMEQSL